jgi:hypothetical protein
MGWTNSHLHQFAKGPVILEPMPEYDFMDMTGTDYAGYKINSLLKEKGDNIRYEYDFGDGWEHILTLEKAIEDFDGNLPVCVDGAMNCPPEDIGGIWGFENFKKALKNPNHPEHKMYKEWIGGDYDPEYFDMEVINDLLMEDNYGMFGW